MRKGNLSQCRSCFRAGGSESVGGTGQIKLGRSFCFRPPFFLFGRFGRDEETLVYLFSHLLVALGVNSDCSAILYSMDPRNTFRVFAREVIPLSSFQIRENDAFKAAMLALVKEQGSRVFPNGASKYTYSWRWTPAVIPAMKRLMQENPLQCSHDLFYALFPHPILGRTSQ
jgi:hypothetical protein